MSARSGNTKDSISRLFEDFTSEGYTPIPHDLLDWIAPVLTEAELRVLIYICRRTYGFRKRSDRISLNQFCAGLTSRFGRALDLGTGLSRQGVLNAIAGLEEKELIRVLPGRGRGQVNEYEICLSSEALARIETLQMTPREKVNAVDPLRKLSTPRSPDGSGPRKGQQPTSERVKMTGKSAPQKVNGVDPQEKASIQEQGYIQQKAGFARNDELTPQKNHPDEDEDLEAKLERTTGQRLTSGERTKLQRLTSFDPNQVALAVDTFSTEAHWSDAKKKNAAFLRYLEGVTAERSTEKYYDTEVEDCQDPGEEW